MKTPDCVIWALTRKNNAYLKKFNGNQWSSNPLSTTGFHNASQSASTCSVQGVKRVVAAKKDDEKKNEKSKKVFQVVLRHRMRHGKKVTKKNSQSGVLVSRHAITKPLTNASKAVSGLTYQSDAHKKQLLRRLYKVNKSLRSSV